MNVVFFTGAGISAESGLKTFRGGNGLWDEYKIEDVCTPQGWKKNPKLVLDFYNKRRSDCSAAKPNAAHIAIGDFAKNKKFKVSVVTQNVDNLHERGGASNLIHLHGSLYESKSTIDPSLIYTIESDIKIGDKCSKGSQLRPNIVWFGEMLDEEKISKAEKLVTTADYLVIVGTSLEVYPAAGIVKSTKETCQIYYVDPGEFTMYLPAVKRVFLTHIKEPATTGVPKVIDEITELSE